MININWGEINQLIGSILVFLGIIIEFQFGANIGFLLITAGSVLFAIGTKIKHR